MIHPAIAFLAIGLFTFSFWFGLAAILTRYEKRRFINRKKASDVHSLSKSSFVLGGRFHPGRPNWKVVRPRRSLNPHLKILS